MVISRDLFPTINRSLLIPYAWWHVLPAFYSGPIMALQLCYSSRLPIAGDILLPVGISPAGHILNLPF